MVSVSGLQELRVSGVAAEGLQALETENLPTVLHVQLVHDVTATLGGHGVPHLHCQASQHACSEYQGYSKT